MVTIYNLINEFLKSSARIERCIFKTLGLKLKIFKASKPVIFSLFCYFRRLYIVGVKRQNNQNVGSCHRLLRENIHWPPWVGEDDSNTTPGRQPDGQLLQRPNHSRLVLRDQRVQDGVARTRSCCWMHRLGARISYPGHKWGLFRKWKQK